MERGHLAKNCGGKKIGMDSGYLANLLTYHRAGENCKNDHHIFPGPSGNL
jgi:hypothetical protein